MRKPRWILILTLLITFGMLLVAAVAGGTEDSSTASAIQDLGQADPAAIAPSTAVHTADGQQADPTLSTSSDGFTSSDTPAESTVAKDPADGFTLQTDSGTLTLTPVGVSKSASDGTLVAGGDAVLYADTQTGADTVVRPKADGVETFTNIADSSAPETYSWQVNLQGDQQLQQNAAGGVDIVDPTPNKSLSDLGDKPASQSVDQAQLGDLKAEGKVEQDAQVQGQTAADQTSAPDTAQSLDSTGAAPPDATPSDASVSSAADTSSSDSTPPSDAPADTSGLPASVAQAASDGVAAAQQQSADATQQSVDAKAAQDAAAEQQVQAQQTATDLATANQPQVVATVQPPSATDAAGNDVPTSLSVSGDTLTMTVDHRQSDVTYPVAADPWITLAHTHDTWVCCRPTKHTASYIDSYYISGWNTVGYYFGVVVWSLPHSYYGSGWYWVYSSMGWVLMNPSIPWSPLYAPVYSPHWTSYTYYTNDPYVKTVTDYEDVWINDSNDIIEDPQAVVADSPFNGTPHGWCANGVTAAGIAYSHRHKWVVRETSGDAMGWHVFRASVTSDGWQCEDRRTLVNWDLWYDTSALTSATVWYQLQARRFYNDQMGLAHGPGGAVTFRLDPGTRSCGCKEWSNLPSYEFPATPLASDNGLIRDIHVPLAPLDEAQGQTWTSIGSPGLAARMRWKR